MIYPFPTHKKRLRIILAALPFLLFTRGIVSQAQTAIVVFRTPNEIVIASDSVTYTPATKTAERSCKIRRTGIGFFAAASTYIENPLTGFSVYTIASKAFKRKGTPLERMRRFIDMVTPPLSADLEAARTGASQIYRDKFDKHDKVVLQAVILAFKGNTPILMERDFFLSNQNDSPVSLRVRPRDCPGDCDINMSAIFFMGITDHMQPYLESIAAESNGVPIDEGRIPNIAREAVRSEVGKHAGVGLPIDVLRVTKDGACWVPPKTKKDCDDPKIEACKAKR